MNLIISLIAAMAHNRVIGYQNKMPWHLPAELAYFKSKTIHKTVLMGRKTFESMGQALPLRRNIILSSQKSLTIPHCECYPSLESALLHTHFKENEELMIIGGGALFTQTLPLAQKLYLTFIEADFIGDTFFPEWNPAEWKIAGEEFHPADQKNLYSFKTQILERLI